MKILYIITIFLLVSSTIAYPSKPLDERSTELTWQAWLLVDDQNQNKQLNEEGGGMKKKVIPKSVFIVPTFNPEKLPPCADGYAPDSMGRCLEVFQVNPENQLKFLLSKLQSHLESSHKTSSGPEKFTIEIPAGDPDNDDTRAALILTQNPKTEEMNGNLVTSHGNPDLSKINVQDKNSEEVTEITTTTPTTSISTETETTTTDQIVTEQTFSTISNFGDEETTVEEGTITTMATFVEEDITETIPTTSVTEDNRQAIFFKLPLATSHKSEQSNSDFRLSSRIRFRDDVFSNDQPSQQPTRDSTNLDYVSNSRVIFRDSSDTNADLLTSENVRHTTNAVRFPNDSHQTIRRNTEQYNLNKNSQNQNNNLYHNHRNRDKNFWRLKPSWKNSDERDMFVVNLSKINFNDLLVQNRHSSPMYRQIPSEHLSYIFGRRNNNSNR